MSDDFGSRMNCVVCVLPAAGFDPPFDVDGLAFAQSLLARFSQVAPRHDVNPVRLCPAVVLWQSVREGHDNAKGCDRLTRRRVAHLWPASKTTDQRNSVQTSRMPFVHCVFRLDIRANDHIS